MNVNISDLSGMVVGTNASNNINNLTTPVKDLDFTKLFSDRQKPDVSRTYQLTSGTDRSTNFVQTNNKVKEISSKKEVSAVDITQEDLESVQDNIVSLVSNQLGLSKDEVKTQLQKMNMSAFDLLDPSNLAQFVGTVTNITDSMSLLTDNNMKTLLEGMDDISKQLMNQLDINAQQLATLIVSNKSILDETLEQTDFTKTLEQTDVTETMNSLEQSNQEVVIDNLQVEDGVQLAQTSPMDENSSFIVSEITPEKVTQATIPEEAVTANNLSINNDIAVEDNTSAEGNIPMKVVHLTVNQEEQSVESFKSLTEANPVEESLFDQNNEGNSDSLMNFMGQDQTATFWGNDGLAGVDKQVTVPFDMQQIINEVTEFSKLSIGKEISTMEIQLTPENLGKVYIQVSSHAEHIIAQIEVENQAVKEAIESHVNQLKENLAQAGVKVSAVEVTIASHEFERNLGDDGQQDKQQMNQKEPSKRRRIQLANQSLDQLIGVLSEEDQIVAKMMSEQGNRMDYQA